MYTPLHGAHPVTRHGPLQQGHPLQQQNTPLQQHTTSLQQCNTPLQQQRPQEARRTAAHCDVEEVDILKSFSKVCSLFNLPCEITITADF